MSLVFIIYVNHLNNFYKIWKSRFIVFFRISVFCFHKNSIADQILSYSRWTDSHIHRRLKMHNYRKCEKSDRLACSSKLKSINYFVRESVLLSITVKKNVILTDIMLQKFLILQKRVKIIKTSFCKTAKMRSFTTESIKIKIILLKLSVARVASYIKISMHPCFLKSLSNPAVF